MQKSIWNSKNNSITCIAPTKTFNIAGLQTAAVYVKDPFLRHKVWRGLNTDEVAEPNVFAALAAETAFNFGEDWLISLNEYLFENRRVFEEYVLKNIPKSWKSIFIRNSATNQRTTRINKPLINFSLCVRRH